RIVVVEGYMDVIALANAGFSEAVAPLGTALTEQQIELLWRLVEVPVLCFDGDAAGQRAAMRAITRALPLLRPAQSLAIVRLPAGLDPDDLIRQQGPGAMAALLGQPASLLDTLWDHEREAQPLRSPEDKAGLKQRLMDHVETIQHPDIRALYKRELMDRFSAFAFPPRAFPARERSEWKPRGERGPLRPEASPDGGATMRRIMQGNGQDAVAGAVLAGLARYPDVALAHADTLARFAEAEPRHASTIDALLDAAEGLDSASQLPISNEQGPGAPPDSTRFVFLKDTTDPATARVILAEAIALLVERPALEAALKAATARFATDPEGAFAEQQRLAERKLEIQRRLGQMASRGAALAAHDDSAHPAADNPPDDRKTD
ncbi:MAG: DNA primase, partial [Erythrobacter sp. 34-65-8]